MLTIIIILIVIVVAEIVTIRLFLKEKRNNPTGLFASYTTFVQTALAIAGIGFAVHSVQQSNESVIEAQKQLEDSKKQNEKLIGVLTSIDSTSYKLKSNLEYISYSLDSVGLKFSKMPGRIDDVTKSILSLKSVMAILPDEMRKVNESTNKVGIGMNDVVLGISKLGYVLDSSTMKQLVLLDKQNEISQRQIEALIIPELEASVIYKNDLVTLLIENTGITKIENIQVNWIFTGFNTKTDEFENTEINDIDTIDMLSPKQTFITYVFQNYLKKNYVQYDNSDDPFEALLDRTPLIILKPLLARGILEPMIIVDINFRRSIDHAKFNLVKVFKVDWFYPFENKRYKKYYLEDVEYDPILKNKYLDAYKSSKF